MSAADHGETDRAILTLQATVKDLSARLVQLEARVDALGLRVVALESAGPSSESAWQYPDDGCTMTEQEKVAMRERLRKRQAEGMEAHRKDPGYAARTFRREAPKT